jgi:putative ABC transport system ATP-binding protein
MLPLVHTVGISKRYCCGGAVIEAVSDISIAIAKGEFVAIRGRSGSGKTTLMNLLGLLERPDCGYYALDGRNIGDLKDDRRAELRNRNIGFIFQQPILLPRTSALENVELPLIYAGTPAAQRHRRSRAALDRVGLSHRGSHWANQLSGGEQQRVVIARALVNDPSLILADEPTGALDSRTSDDILRLFEQLHRDGHTIVVVTHAADVADRARRQIMLHDGRVISDDETPTSELHLKPSMVSAPQ